MTEKENDNSWTLTLNAVSIALVAALVTQVVHESCHAIAVVLVGARLEWFNLLAVSYDWAGEASRWGDMIIAGNPTLINILTGTIAVKFFSRRWARQRPTLRLFLLYFSAYSLLTGFANLIIAALIYQPGGQNPSDWARVLDLLNVNLAVRIPIGLVGAAGYRWVYFWLVRSTLRFGEGVAAERYQRARLAGPLLMDPYLMINAIFLILSIWNPLGFGAFLIIVLQYLLAYIAFFVAFFGMVYWTKVETSPPDATPLPVQFSWPWIVGAAAALVIAIAVLLPTIYF